jgi:hypothetical protein
MDFDLEGARKAGYSDDEIAAYLSKQKNFDKDAAEKAGYSPLEIINHLQPQAAPKETAPKSGKAAANAEAVSGFQELFGRDPSKAGKLTGSDYAARIAAGTATGGAIGAGIGLVTGPGAIVTGTVGAIGGATSSLIEAFLEDAGFGKGTQIAGGMLVPGGMGTKVGQYIESKIVDKALTYGVKKATGIPMAGTAVKAGKEFMERRRPADVEGLSKTLGEEAKTIGVGNTKYIDEVNADLAKQHPNLASTPDKPISHGLYEEAKAGADNVSFPKGGALGGEHFSITNEFDSLSRNIPAEQEKFGKLFLDEKGNSLVGSDIVNNLQYSDKMSFSDLTKARNAFNDYLERTTGKRSEEIARKAYEKERVALAKDTLPSLFTNNNLTAVNKQLENLGKSPEGAKLFKQEFLNYLKTSNAQDAKAAWGQLGPNVKKFIIKDPAEYQKVTDIINGAKSKQEIGRAARLIMRTATPYAIGQEKNL